MIDEKKELKTIKELATELGVSKQTIQYHIKFLPTKNRQKTDKRKHFFVWTNRGFERTKSWP